MDRPLHIALAEDDDMTRDHLAGMLRRLGHDVKAVGDGQRLVELCRADTPDVVVTDIKMPGMDGLEATEIICRERQVPVILVTAYHAPELYERAGACAVMAYLIKPVQPAKLEAALRLALHRFALHEEARRVSEALRRELEERKYIERAKGVVMRRLAIEEGDAYRCLRTLAGNKNTKMIDIAREVIEAEDVFRELEKTLSAPANGRSGPVNGRPGRGSAG
jgi:AmiR/NasT family two-component response regulator